jgi:hypothetical protein
METGNFGAGPKFMGFVNRDKVYAPFDGMTLVCYQFS